LTEGTVAQNIAFSVPDDQIDWDRVYHCARQAHIDEYVSTLPNGYQTLVGENGSRLSGGQRQRIGIARALYSQCDVLVFDEATNALDAATERAILTEVQRLEKKYTIIVVAHNLQAVEHCHRKLVLGNGNAKWSSI
jgi:ABC-type bacteriocin/lantibiotic exporter with double-glycine peptidase domain